MRMCKPIIYEVAHATGDDKPYSLYDSYGDYMQFGQPQSALYVGFLYDRDKVDEVTEYVRFRNRRVTMFQPTGTEFRGHKIHVDCKDNYRWSK